MEILLVVGIISILAGIVIVAINPSKQLATVRNAERKSDIKQIDSALTQYYIDNFHYPTSTPSTLTEICKTGSGTYPQDDICDGFFDLSVLVPNYITAIPTDPQATSTEYGSGYYFKQDSNTNKIITVASNAELEQFIAIGTSTNATPQEDTRPAYGNWQNVTGVTYNGVNYTWDERIRGNNGEDDFIDGEDIAAYWVFLADNQDSIVRMTSHHGAWVAQGCATNGTNWATGSGMNLTEWVSGWAPGDNCTDDPSLPEGVTAF